jgi:hypothetical protein
MALNRLPRESSEEADAFLDEAIAPVASIWMVGSPEEWGDGGCERIRVTADSVRAPPHATFLEETLARLGRGRTPVALAELCSDLLVRLLSNPSALGPESDPSAIRRIILAHVSLAAIERAPSFTMSSGDLLVLYTDGIVEHSRGTQMYGFERLKEII